MGTNILIVSFVRELTTLKINASPYMVFLAIQQTSFNLIRFNHIEEYQEYFTYPSLG